MPNPALNRTERMEFRLTPHLKQQLQLVATLSGRTLSDIVTQSVDVFTTEYINRKRETIKLAEADTQVLTEALANPPSPSPALIELFRSNAENLQRIIENPNATTQYSK